AVPSLVLVFASPSHSLSAVMSRVHARFPEATCLGATTAGELTEHGDAKRAIAGVAVTGDFRVRAGIGSQLGDDPEAAVRTAIGAIPAQLAGFPHRTALILLDPLTGRGEEAT